MGTITFAVANATMVTEVYDVKRCAIRELNLQALTAHYAAAKAHVIPEK
jgi:hypothetical protein